MGASTTTLQSVVDDALSSAELAPALATGGFSDAPALSIANDIMQAMCAGGPDGQPMPWKWNRMKVPPFLTNSWQQDYAVLGVTKVSWLEHAYAVDINSTGCPKPTKPIEVKRDLEATFAMTGHPAKLCWLPNSQLLYGIWGQAQSVSPTGLKNPGAGVIYSNPLGAVSTPNNAVTQIEDPNGNLLVLTTYGTCGSVTPTWPAASAAAGTLVTDGTCVWTVVDPAGQGFRLDPLPPTSSVVWQINIVAQAKPVSFKALSQTLDPLPDDHSSWFKQGFFAQCYRRNPDAKVRAKFQQEWVLFLKGLDNAVKSGNREPEDIAFVPDRSIMDGQYGASAGPNWPWGA